MKNSRSIFFIIIEAFLKAFLFVLMLSLPQQAISQQTTKKPQKIEIINQSKQTTKEPQKGTINPRKSVSKLPGFMAAPPDSGDQIPHLGGGVPPDELIWMEFALDWTNCQIHRVNTDSAIVIILPGTISSSSRIYWNLHTMSPHPGGFPILYFVNDVLGRTGPEFGTDIPLTWEIALDGGSFNPITILRDKTLLVTFPPGNHTFQVRITGVPQPYQGDGYYQLQLGQSLVPEL